MSTLRGPAQLADLQGALCVPTYNSTLGDGAGGGEGGGVEGGVRGGVAAAAWMALEL